MAAQNFFLPYQAAVKPTSIAAPGSKTYFYQPGTTTLKAIYATSALTTQLSNPVIADGAGRLPNIYLDGAEQYRIEIYDKDDALLFSRDPYIPGSIDGITLTSQGYVAADRTALAALGGAAGATVVLTEAGREGTFVWSSADNSANVTADTLQGVYVPPAADTTGASGAWVRKYDGAINAAWFGTGSAAMAAVQTLVGAMARAGYGYNNGVPMVRVPFSVVSFTAAFDITWPIHWIADGDGGASNAATVLAWDNTSSGLRIQYVDTTGDSGTQSAAAHSGSGAIFDGFHLDGGFSTGTEAERHAVHARAKVLLRNCNMFNWAGDAIRPDASTIGAHKGNANIVKAENCWAENCRSGWAPTGNDDTNAGHLIGFSANGCRRSGLLEGSFLGNQVFGGHFDANARTSWNSGEADHPCSYCFDSGHVYFFIHGRDPASVAAPSGTTADNADWGYWKDQGAADPATGIPQWAPGLVVRSGGPIIVTGLSNATTIFGPHIENNGVSQLDQLAFIVGGNQGYGSAVSVTSATLSRNRVANLRASSAGLTCDGNFTIFGDLKAGSPTNTLGPVGATIQDGVTILGTRNASHTIQFSILDSVGTATSSPASIILGSGFGASFDMVSAANFWRFKIGGNERFKVDDTGAIIDSAKALFVGANAVVKARKSGWAVDTGTAKRTANASYSAGATLTFSAGYVQAEHTAVGTRLGLIEAALQDATQTIKALKDDLHGTAGHGLIGT